MSGNNTNNSDSKSPFIIWYDSKAYDKQNKADRELLQATIGNLMIFNDKEAYQRFLGRDLHKKRLILIISGQLGQEIVPLIHDYESILSIYVYCSNKKLHDKWAQQYAKVKAVVTSVDELVSEVLSDSNMTA